MQCAAAPSLRECECGAHVLVLVLVLEFNDVVIFESEFK